MLYRISSTQNLCKYAAWTAVTLPSISAHFTEAVACGNNSVVQHNSYGQPCYYPDPSPTASLPRACSGLLAEVFKAHVLAGDNTSRSIEIYELNTLRIIEPTAVQRNVFSKTVAACATGALVDQFITDCWIVQPGEDVCAGAKNSCGSLHLHGDAVYRDGCTVSFQHQNELEWLTVLPWQMVGWFL